MLQSSTNCTCQVLQHFFFKCPKTHFCAKKLSTEVHPQTQNWNYCYDSVIKWYYFCPLQPSVLATNVLEGVLFCVILFGLGVNIDTCTIETNSSHTRLIWRTKFKLQKINYRDWPLKTSGLRVKSVICQKLSRGLRHTFQ